MSRATIAIRMPTATRPQDLNGDGLITMMRVADDAGRWTSLARRSAGRCIAGRAAKKASMASTICMSKAGTMIRRPAAHRPGRGVAFNHNFPFRYPYFKPLAGPNAVSEIETRAVADFAFDHPNIADRVLAFRPKTI